MRIDRPSGRPEDRREGDSPSVPEQPAQETQPRTWERRDDNGRNAAEYKRVESGESAREAAAEERRRRDPSMRDSNGMTAAELRFLRNKRIDEAEARVSEADGPVIDPASRRSVVTDAQGRTGAEIRFQQAKRAEEATKARTPEAAAANTEPEPVSEGDGKKSEDRPEAIRAAHDQPKEYAEQRAAELQALLPEARRGRITMGVGVGTDMGGGTRVVIGTSEDNGYLRKPLQLAAGEEIAEAVAMLRRRSLTTWMPETSAHRTSRRAAPSVHPAPIGLPPPALSLQAR